MNFLQAKIVESNAGTFLNFVSVVVGGKEPRKPAIQMFSDEIKPEAPVKVSCDCPYFRVKLAIPLYASGSTDVQIRRSDIPDKYRGIQKPGLCPHLYQLAETIVNGNDTELARLQRTSQNESVSQRLLRLL